MKILIMGLPGSGKTHLAERLKEHLKCAWFNADEMRKMANDWEFSPQARMRQAYRMRNVADYENQEGRDVICDFVCPTPETRYAFDADFTIWMDTIKEGRFEDTNKAFVRPSSDTRIDMVITELLDDKGIAEVAQVLKNFITDANTEQLKLGI